MQFSFIVLLGIAWEQKSKHWVREYFNLSKLSFALWLMKTNYRWQSYSSQTQYLTAKLLFDINNEFNSEHRHANFFYSSFTI